MDAPSKTVPYGNRLIPQLGDEAYNIYLPEGNDPAAFPTARPILRGQDPCTHSVPVLEVGRDIAEAEETSNIECEQCNYTVGIYRAILDASPELVMGKTMGTAPEWISCIFKQLVPSKDYWLGTLDVDGWFDQRVEMLISPSDSDDCHKHGTYAVSLVTDLGLICY